VNRRELIKSGISAALAVSVPIAASEPCDKIELYEVGGVTVFPWYGSTGILTTRQCCFPIIDRKDSYIVMGHYRSLYEEPQQTEEQFGEEGIARFRAAFDPSKVYPEREDGGLMPEDGEIIKFVSTKRYLVLETL
jgi:hypothetical protein